MLKNIVAAIAIHHPKELLMSVNGERVDDYEVVFHHMYYDLIVQAVGHDKWGVWFKQIDEAGPAFEVDIFTNSPQDHAKVARAILENLPADMKFDIMARYWNFDWFVQKTQEATA